MFENDKTSYNLIISAKKLISKLITKNELANNFIKVSIKFIFIYDKPYFLYALMMKKNYF